ncbi:MAG TPA: Na+/H+ antiporter NhaA [Saprospiraceae bacterium]|nr:Na+/H+ antiporter NhaA [Saprospiraceae bacterium]
MKLTKLFTEFFESEKAAGIILLFCTIISLILSNSAWQNQFIQFWNLNLGSHSISHWINDGLMTIFFLLIGLELEREIYIGELSTLKNASLPFFAALGGMLVPAFIFLSINFGLETQSGAGIPMATDIAFALGILSLLGRSVPSSLKVILTALAVIDDLGAILLIAFFYTKSIDFTSLIIAGVLFGFLLILNRFKVQNLLVYIITGIFMWYFMHKSGVHATITGVLLAFALPFGDGGEKSSSYKVQHYLHTPVAFVILPLFAIANTNITFSSNFQNIIFQANSVGIFFGLFLGKPIGIFLFSYVASKFKFCELPSDLRWKHIFGVGFLGGVGFTMAIFITLLAYDTESLVMQSKISILFASLLSGFVGYWWLRFSLTR